MAIKESSEIVEQNLDETAAADTLKPGAGSAGGDIGKTELMASVVSAMGGMSKQEINKFQEVLSQYGKNKLPGGGVPDKSAANKASIAAKGAMKEDVEELLSGDELSEEFREKASTLFEAAVNARVGIEVSRIEEEFEEAVTEVADRLEEEMTSKLDAYLDYVSEQWLEENKIAIEASLKLEATDKLVEGLKGLFAEHCIELPEETTDIVEQLQAQVAELEGKLNGAINESIELKQVINEAEKELVIEEVSEGLAATQSVKLRTLVEDFDASDIDAFRAKVELVKENYFSDKKVTSTNIITEEVVAEDESSLVEETVTNTNPEMNKYVSAISKSLKK